MKITLDQYIAQTGCDQNAAMMWCIWWYEADQGNLMLFVYDEADNLIEERPAAQGFYSKNREKDPASYRYQFALEI